MNLKGIFEALSDFFRQKNMDFAIIGAFALYTYGYSRATKDIDFITRIDNKEKVIHFLESLGFETIFSSEAFSNHLQPVGSVKVDIMYVEGKTADDIFNAVENKALFNGLEFPVASKEHLVAMKLFAIQNNPDRKYKDLADIKEILKNTEYNKEVIREYFKKYGQEVYFNEITEEESSED